MNLLERVHRARRIGAARAKTKPDSWPAIAKREGISQSQVREIHADFTRWEEPGRDVDHVVDELLHTFAASMDELARDIAELEPGNAKVGAIRTLLETAVNRFNVMQAAGRIPRNLGAYTAEREMQTILQAMVRVLERHDLPGEVLDELLAVVENDAPPALEGTARAA